MERRTFMKGAAAVLGTESLGAWYQDVVDASDAKVHPGQASLLEYVKHTTPNWQPAPHLLRAIEVLEAVERGELKRVMLFYPPRHGKSVLCSQRFPSWFMGRNPKSEFIHSSYGGELAASFGRRLRNLMLRGGPHQEVFPNSELSGDSKSVNLWHTSEDGVYCAAGVSGPITGRGADCIVIDDPVKNREEADSEIMRARTWDWYTNDLYTRLHPGASIIVIMTRWHEDDLAGRLLEAQANGGDQWHVLHQPAITGEVDSENPDDGDALWPERYPTPVLKGIRQNVGARAWQALYQGDPSPEKGLYFHRDWFMRAPRPELGELRCYGLSDLARSQSQGDWTVHLMMGIDRDGRPWILDRWADRTSPDRWIPPIGDMVERWRPALWLQEKGPIWSMTEPFVRQELARRKIHVAMEGLPSTVDKEARARGIQGIMASKGLWMDPAAPFASDLIKNLLAFPVSTHDDDVDALSLGGRLGDRLVGPLSHEVAKPPPGAVSFEELRLGTGYGAQKR